MSLGDYFNGVSQGVVGNLITIPIVVGVGYAFISFRFGKLRKFFGVTGDRQLTVFSSTLLIPMGGSAGATGQIRSYQGLAVPTNEVQLIARILPIFEGPVPDLAGLGQPINRLFIKPHQVSHSESYHKGLPDPTVSFITLGSPGYNAVSAAVQSAGFLLAVCAQPNNDALVFAGTTKDSSPTRGFIYRFVDPATGQVGFYVAGISTLGTTAACSHLTRNWRELSKQVGESNQVCWLIETVKMDPERTVVISTFRS